MTPLHRCVTSSPRIFREDFRGVAIATLIFQDLFNNLLIDSVGCWTIKYWTTNLLNLQFAPEKWKPNLKPTKPAKNRTQPQNLLNRMTKNGWFFKVFLLEPNLELTELYFGPKNRTLNLPNRALVSTGATGAAAPETWN